MQSGLLSINNTKRPLCHHLGPRTLLDDRLTRFDFARSGESVWEEPESRTTTGTGYKIPVRGSKFKTDLHREQDVCSSALQDQITTPADGEPGQRLAEAKKGTSASSDQGARPGSSDSPGSNNSSNEDLSQCLPTPVPRSPDGYQAIIGLSTNPDSCVHTTVTANVYGALYINGALMGLACSVTFASKSQPFGPELPDTLRPTPLQLTTVHPQWIDRFPFPKMRDNMITLLSIIDEEEFLGDLFCLTSFTVEPGAASWDPTAWKISKEFGAKWGYLFY